MDLISNLLDLFLHLDEHLSVVIQTYGTWTYLILFLIIFWRPVSLSPPFCQAIHFCSPPAPLLGWSVE